MTAINKDGQIYWTFEELDLDGALDDLRKEIENNFIIIDYYQKNSAEVSKIIGDYYIFRDLKKSIFDRQEILLSVSNSLSDLRYWGVKHG